MNENSALRMDKMELQTEIEAAQRKVNRLYQDRRELIREVRKLADETDKLRARCHRKNKRIEVLKKEISHISIF